MLISLEASKHRSQLFHLEGKDRFLGLVSKELLESTQKNLWLWVTNMLAISQTACQKVTLELVMWQEDLSLKRFYRAHPNWSLDPNSRTMKMHLQQNDIHLLSADKRWKHCVISNQTVKPNTNSTVYVYVYDVSLPTIYSHLCNTFSLWMQQIIFLLSFWLSHHVWFCLFIAHVHILLKANVSNQTATLATKSTSPPEVSLLTFFPTASLSNKAESKADQTVWKGLAELLHRLEVGYV